MLLTGPYSPYDEISLGGDAYDYQNSTYLIGSYHVTRGVIASGDDIDFFQFLPDTDGLYRLTLSNDSTNNWGADWQEGSLELVYLDASGAIIQSYQKLLPEEGSEIILDGYFLSSNSYLRISGDEGAHYVIQLEYIGPRFEPSTYPDDYPDSIQHATTFLDIGADLTGEIEVSRDPDWFKVNLEAGKTYIFELSGSESGGGTLDTYASNATLAILDLPSIHQAFSESPSLDPSSSFTPSISKTYYVAASASEGTGSYTLKVNESTISDDYYSDHNTTGLLTLNGQTTGTIEHAGDQDWFKVSLTADTTYTFNLLASENSGGTLGENGIPNEESRLILYSSANQYKSSTTDGGNNSEPSLTFTPTESGDYFVEVSTLYGTSTGTYTVLAYESSVTDDHGNTGSTSTEIPPGESKTGNIEVVGDSDWFKIDLVAGTTYSFELLGAASGGGTLGSTGDAKLALYSQFESLIHSATSGNTDGDPLISFVPYYTGTHYLSAEGLDNVETGTYTLTVDEGAIDTEDPSTIPPNSEPTGLLLLHGDAAPGELLTAEAGSIDDEDGLGEFSYQWYLDDQTIENATTHTYTVLNTDVGQEIWVEVSYMDGNGTTEIVASEARLPSEPTSDYYTDLIEIYVIILGRAPDSSGLDFWSDKINSGRTLEDVTGAMWNAPGPREIYPSALSTEQIVTSFYNNILNREPDQAGKDFWVNKWEFFGPAETMLRMINALKGNNSTDPQAIADKTLFQAKVDIGGYLATTADSDNLGLAHQAFDYLESGYSVTETMTYIDNQLSLIGQSETTTGDDLFA